MAYADYEGLLFGKFPVWLYRITVDGVAYHYTPKAGGYITPNNSPSTDFPTGQVWAWTSINRSDIYQTVKETRSDLTCQVFTRSTIAQLIIQNPDTQRVEIEIWQGFKNDPDQEFALFYKGSLDDHEPAMVLTNLIFSTSVSEAAKSSVAQVVQRTCRHAHYFTNADGHGCRLTLSDFQTSLEVTAVSSRTLTVPAAANEVDGYYLAGILEYAGVEYMIQSHVGETLLIEKVVPDLETAVGVGTTNVLLARGCNGTIQTCQTFDNLVNFGGFNNMKDSKFDGRSIA